MDVKFILLVGGIVLCMFLLVQLYTSDFLKRLLSWLGLRSSKDLENELNGYERTQIILDPIKKKQKETYEMQPGKRLWDWLQLLLIPFVLFLITYLFNSYQTTNSLQIEDKSQQEQVVDSYLNQMSTILQHDNLLTSNPDDPMRALAQAITLAALDRLDSGHKNIIILFLYRADLLKYHYYKHQETECGDPNVLIKQFPNDEKPIITLSQGNIDGVAINDLGLSCIDLHNMELNGSNFSESDLDRADLGLSFAVNANFSYASMFAANLFFLDLEYANLQHTDLQVANMKGICLSHAQLDGADLKGADLRPYLRHGTYTILFCDQRYNDLHGNTTLVPANLSDASLPNANLTGANLSGADLAGANLSGANLTYANFTGANLAGANLIGANWSHAKISQEQLAEAITHAALSIPAGSKP